MAITTAAGTADDADVLVIGAGVMGASVTFWLTRLRPGVRVVLLEADTGFARASSSLSASSIRQQFSCTANIRLSRFGWDFLRRSEDWLPGWDPGLVESGYLYLASEAQTAALREVHRIQRDAGVDVSLLEPAALAQRFPWLDASGIALASLGMSAEGWFDGPGLHRALLHQALRANATLHRARVQSLCIESDGAGGVLLEDGKRLRSRAIVLAAGAWSGALAASAGVVLPVEGRRRSVFVLSCPQPLPGCPLIVDSSGFWLRPEGRFLITGQEPLEDRAGLRLEPDWREFGEQQWQRLATRIPALAELRVERAWAGYYEINTFDHNAVIGPHPHIRGLHFLCGFSGHGIQQAAGAGLAAAEWLLDGAPRTLDVRELGFARLLRDQPLRERNVIG